MRVGLAAGVGAIILTACLLASLGGCAAAGHGPEVINREGQRPPDLETIAKRHNDRVSALEHLTSAIVVTVGYQDEEARARSEQFEGALLYARPSRVHLRFDKVSQTYALLGCNESVFWWMDLREGGRAWHGANQDATSAALENLGVRVHPQDLVEALGVSPIAVDPEGAPMAGAATPVSWSDDGRSVVVTQAGRVSGRMGARTLWIDPTSGRITRIELRRSTGDLVLTSVLGEHTRVEGGSGSISQRTEIVLASEEGQPVRIGVYLSEPRSGGRPPKAEAFDLDALVKRYRVDERIDLSTRVGEDEEGGKE